MFDDIAPQLIEMLDGRMMVAHDASFDHRFLKLVAMRAGIDMPTKQRLCVAQPVIDNGFVQRTFDVSDMSAQRAIDRLVDAGVLHQTSKGDETAYGKPTKSSMSSITSPNAPVGLGGSGT